jgi:hypothetical protein
LSFWKTSPTSWWKRWNPTRNLWRSWSCSPPSAATALPSSAGPGSLGLSKPLRRNPGNRAPVSASIAKPVKAVANRAYYLGRLEREFPALAARIHTSELSVYRASIEAGLRKPPARNWTQPDAYRFKLPNPALKKIDRGASPGAPAGLRAAKARAQVRS